MSDEHRLALPALPLTLRGAALLALWVVLDGSLAPANLLVGLIAAALGAWASLRLAPPRQLPGLRPVALAILLLRLPVQMLVAGFDVAMRALAPRPLVRPGLVEVAPTMPPGPERGAFLALASLLPGTVPAGTDGGGGVTIHALDIQQQVAADFRREEARFIRAIGADV